MRQIRGKQMQFLIQNLVTPAVHRLGTYVGGYFTAQGMAADDINIVLAAIPVLAGFVVDTIVRKAF